MFVVKTLSGLETILAGELRELGAKNIQILTRAVSFEGDQEMICKANYLCRTALRVLVPLARFPASNEDQLYRGVKAIDWSGYLNNEMTFAVDSTVSHSNLTHSYYVALKTKDAIADFFYDRYGKRPSVDTDDPSLRINVHLWNNECTVSSDSSGDSLHKRGYRKAAGEAPINEVLAAGLIYLSGWKFDRLFLDPFCGSGTLLMEAAMITHKIPAGYFRESFGFEKWKNFDSSSFENIKVKYKSLMTGFNHKIIGSDISVRALQTARRNLKLAGLEKDIGLVHSAFEKMNPPGKPGIIVTNPPYGERMVKEDIKEFYRQIGNSLKTRFAGYEAWIITSDFDAIKSVGLRTSAKFDVFNGKLPCKFVKFDIYEGSRKQTATRQR